MLMALLCFGFVAAGVGAARGTSMLTSIQSTPAHLVSHFPTADATGVPKTTKVMASFSRPLEGAAEQLKIVVKDDEGQPVAGAVRFNNTLDTATLQPTDPLKPGSYAVSITLPNAQGSQDELNSWKFQVKKPVNLEEGAGGSLLLIAAPNTHDSYLAEILRAEGLNGFDTRAPEAIDARVLEQHAVAIVGAGASSDKLAAVLRPWVREGGAVVAMSPQGDLAQLAGLTPVDGELRDAYLKVDGSRAPGKGITSTSIQFHGTATRYRAGADATSVATLYSDPTTSAKIPAVTVRNADQLHGQVAAFTYDLATSVLYTRQGNPAWAGQERDGIPPIRPNDLFHGANNESDYLDLDKIGIPQADEQMRLLTNILEFFHKDSTPLPRFWYLPNGANVALLMAADDHGTEDGTKSAFEHMLELDPPGCEARVWKCPRATSWMYASSSLTDDQASDYSDQSFDLGAHITTQCHDWSRASLDVSFGRSLKNFREKYPSLPAQQGNRLHCIAWSDWVTQPMVERSWGIRLDMNYFNWPPDWISHRPGYMTGSSLPMRFSTDDGQLIDVFQQETHLVNETWKDSPEAIEALISAARDDRGYFGVLGTHFDFSDDFGRQLMDTATRLDVPMISAKQLLEFTDGRNASTVTDLVTEKGEVGFTVSSDSRVEGMLQVMLPVRSDTGELSALRSEGEKVSFKIRTIKGIDYAFFTAESGIYSAEYR